MNKIFKTKKDRDNFVKQLKVVLKKDIKNAEEKSKLTAKEHLEWIKQTDDAITKSNEEKYMLFNTKTDFGDGTCRSRQNAYDRNPLILSKHYNPETSLGYWRWQAKYLKGLLKTFETNPQKFEYDIEEK